MKKLFTVLLILTMVFTFAACGNDQAEEGTNAEAEAPTTLVLGTSADYAPYEFMYPDENGTMQYGGIDISVSQYIADYAGLELQIENMNFEYLLTALNKGDFDMVLACIEPTEDRVKACDFSEAYIYELPEMILVRAEDADKYTDIATSFDGVSVGAQSGTTKVAKVGEYLTGAVCVELTSVNDLVNELVNGKIDAVYLDGGVAVNFAQTNPDLVVCSASDAFADQSNYCAVAVAKGDPKGLLPMINEAIAKMTEEGKIEDFQALADELSGVAEEVTEDAPEGYTPDSELTA